MHQEFAKFKIPDELSWTSLGDCVPSLIRSGVDKEADDVIFSLEAVQLDNLLKFTAEYINSVKLEKPNGDARMENNWIRMSDGKLCDMYNPAFVGLRNQIDKKGICLF